MLIDNGTEKVKKSNLEVVKRNHQLMLEEIITETQVMNECEMEIK